YSAELPGKALVLKFDAYSPAAATDEIIRRIMSPVSADRIQSHFGEEATTLPQQSILLKKENFDFYLPSGEAPAKGYGLLVFIAPYDQAEIPSEWRKILDRAGIIYVAARKSGNDHHMIGRRIPLALHAYENVSQQYRLDPQRVYISGFSGGSRTAMRVALAFPDIFSGAILNAGSDPFGNTGIAIPPKELFTLFQNHSRIVQVTGTEDDLVVTGDARMRKSARDLCVRHLASQPMRRTGHALIGGRELDSALSWLEKPDTNAGDSTSCSEKLQLAIDSGLHEVQDSITNGSKQKAGKQISAIDNSYGGLAAPASVELARKILSMENIE
ncbi:MAG: hypothetical protein ACREO2_11830, partial [Arenimonas sp.]